MRPAQAPDSTDAALSMDSSYDDPSLQKTRLRLDAHGVSTSEAPASLWGMLGEAVASLRRGLQQSSAAELTVDEVATLERGGFRTRDEEVPLEEDPVARGAAAYAALLETAASVAETARRAGVSEGRIRQRLTAEPPTLVGVRLHDGWRIPAFQFDAKQKLLPGLERVVAALDTELHPLALQHWFLDPHPELELPDGGPISPRDWLAHGLPADTVAALADLL